MFNRKYSEEEYSFLKSYPEKKNKPGLKGLSLEEMAGWIASL